MLDPMDKRIIETLQKQGRITNVDLARMNDMAPSSMLERVRRLEERGVITGYRAELNPKMLGYQVQAMVAISLDRHQAGPIDVFENKIRAIPEVMACMHVTGRYDYLVYVAVRDIDHLGELIKHALAGIAGVEKQETFLVLSTVKENHGYSLEGITPNE